ncbi:MAG: hypothetical protein CMK63_11810 [Pseudoalteromonadaceae bacterium]|nr:hypothetical protein [Pseudoalteromonadaceae bacterium]
MHIVLMLILVVLGLALSDKVGLIIGGPICIWGLMCFVLGSESWRQIQENLFLEIGLICLALIFVGNIIGF